jgi:hypothetical protein
VQIFTASFAYCTLYLWLTILDAHMHIANKFCEVLVGVQVKNITTQLSQAYGYVGASPRMCV